MHRYNVKMIKNVVMSQNIRNNAKLQKWSKYNDLQRFDVKTIYNDEVRRKTFKTMQNCKSNQITMNCIDITSKWSKMLLCRKTFKTTQNYKNYQITWISSIWCPNDQNNAKQRKWSNYDQFASIWPNDQNNAKQRIASIWGQNDLKCWVTSQTIQNYAKLRKWSKYNDLHRFDVQTIKTTQNNESDQITMNLHRFDVKTI